MHARGPARVVVGVDRSLAGLRALRLAVAEARRRDAVLHAVRAWNFDPTWHAAPAEWSRELEREASETISRAFEESMGGMPDDLDIVEATASGPVAAALVRYAHRDDDVLVVGSSARGWLRRLLAGSVTRQCVARASCPVLVVPADEFARTAARTHPARHMNRDLASLTR
jgi:nucleotide-binding universal stress UspA family protein